MAKPKLVVIKKKCPHCREVVQLVKIKSVACPLCGKAIRL